MSTRHEPDLATDAVTGTAGGADGWFWASDAPAEGARIEMRHRDDGGMDVRTSADPARVLSYTRNEWIAFVDGCENHEFDHLATDTPNTL